MEPNIDQLEQAFKIESTSRFPDALVDEKGRVYFDFSKASLDAQHSVLRRARRRDRFMSADGKTYYAARLLRRHLPRKVRRRFDELVNSRKEVARDWLRAGRNTKGLLSQ